MASVLRHTNVSVTQDTVAPIALQVRLPMSLNDLKKLIFRFSHVPWLQEWRCVCFGRVSSSLCVHTWLVRCELRPGCLCRIQTEERSQSRTSGTSSFFPIWSACLIEHCLIVSRPIVPLGYLERSNLCGIGSDCTRCHPCCTYAWRYSLRLQGEADLQASVECGGGRCILRVSLKTGPQVFFSLLLRKVYKYFRAIAMGAVVGQGHYESLV